MFILLKGLSRQISHLEGIHLWFCLFSLAQCTVFDVFVDFLAYVLPVILAFEKMIGSVNSLGVLNCHGLQ